MLLDQDVLTNPPAQISSLCHTQTSNLRRYLLLTPHSQSTMNLLSRGQGESSFQHNHWHKLVHNTAIKSIHKVHHIQEGLLLFLWIIGLPALHPELNITLHQHLWMRRPKKLICIRMKTPSQQRHETLHHCSILITVPHHWSYQWILEMPGRKI